MHEGNFTHQIVESILDELKQHPESRPTRVQIKVGETLHLERESVLTHFEALSKGTELEGAVLDLKEDPMVVECNQCAWKGPVEDHHFPLCSACGEMDVHVLSGTGVVIESIDLA